MILKPFEENLSNFDNFNNLDIDLSIRITSINEVIYSYLIDLTNKTNLNNS